MKKTVYFIRHAKSSWSDPRLKDIHRPLNPRGLRDAPFMAQMLAGRAQKIDKIVSSPALRAKTTAIYFAKAFQIPKAEILEIKNIYEASPQSLLDIVKAFDNQWDKVLVFGHNPGFTLFANMFASQAIDNVPTCGIVKIDTNVDSWEEIAPGKSYVSEFHYPKQYFPKK